MLERLHKLGRRAIRGRGSGGGKQLALGDSQDLANADETGDGNANELQDNRNTNVIANVEGEHQNEIVSDEMDNSNNRASSNSKKSSNRMSAQRASRQSRATETASKKSFHDEKSLPPSAFALINNPLYDGLLRFFFRDVDREIV